MNMKSIIKFCSLNMGQSPDSKTYNTNGDGMPFYQGNADFGEMHPVTRIWCSQPVKKAKKGDILISVRAPIGAMNIANEDCCIGRGLAALTPNNDTSTKYLYYALQSRVDSLIAKGTGSTFKAISKKTLEETLLPAYATTEQDKIVSRLEIIDSLIVARQKQLECLEQLVKSRFIELFGDPILNSKGFVEGSVSEYCKMTQGTQIPMSEQINEYQQGYYRYLYIRDLKYNDSDWIYVQDKYDDKKLTEKDLVVVNTGNTAGEIYYGKDGILSNNLFKVSFDADVLNTTYMFAYFSSQQFQSMLWSEMKEGTQPHLGHKIFGSKKLIIPPMDLQNQFASFVEQTDKSKYCHYTIIDILRKLTEKVMKYE